MGLIEFEYSKFDQNPEEFDEKKLKTILTAKPDASHSANNPYLAKIKMLFDNLKNGIYLNLFKSNLIEHKFIMI